VVGDVSTIRICGASLALARLTTKQHLYLKGNIVTEPNVHQFAAYFDLLGRKIKDKVSSQEGVCDAITFDLYGCIQVAVSPRVDKEGKFVEGRMLDVHRVQVIDGDDRVMPRPTYVTPAATINLLGKKARDRISGMTGVVSSIGFELCDNNMRAAISPPVDKDGKHVDGRWMSVSRIEVVGDEQVMPVPAFSTAQPTYGATPQQHMHGPADTPPLSTTSIGG
jgi:hypothetical protein